MTDEPNTAEQHLPTGRRLWSGWLLPVAAWASHLFLSYSLVEWYCENQAALTPTVVKIFLHGLTFLCLVLALGGVWLARGAQKQLSDFPAETRSRGYSRSQFMAKSGLALGLFMAIVILVQGLPNVVLQPCVR